MVSGGWDVLTIGLIQLYLVDKESLYHTLLYGPCVVTKEGVATPDF
jgi:hypothetical protein